MSEELQGYACWNPEAATIVSARDAGSLPSWLFKAVHHPLKAKKRELSQTSGGSWVSESAVLEALKGDVRADGYLLIPVVGNSGTGKSHLVKWAYESTKAEPKWHSLYLAKNRTSLMSVIEKLIDDLPPAQAAKHRKALETAPAQQETNLVTKLIDGIAEQIEARDFGVGITDKKTQQVRNAVQKDLPTVLRDPVSRPALTSEGGVIPRLVGLAQKGREENDGLDDNAVQVNETDLPLKLKKLEDASADLRQTIAKWQGNQILRETAVSLVNEVLPSVIAGIFISGQTDLIEIFRDLRQDLNKQGKELVLFIEDLTVLHGIEQEFLDAIIEPKGEGDSQMCDLRVLFAITVGHFDALDTVRTRCDDAYWLDTSFESGEITPEEVVSFVGRYLNAARLDLSGTSGNKSSQFTNVCETCPHNEGGLTCHSIFDKSEDGYGLYPFNQASVSNFVDAHSRADGDFDPRRTVRGLGDFLKDAETQIEEKNFPSGRITDMFQDTGEQPEALLLDRLGTKWPSNSDQAVALVRFWANGQSTIKDTDDLALAVSTDVLNTFGLSPEGVTTVTPPPPKPNGPEKPPPPEISETWTVELSGTRHKELVDQLDRWARKEKGGALTAPQTNAVKKLVYDTIRENLSFGAVPFNNKAIEQRFTENHIAVKGSITRGSRSSPVITIEQSSEMAVTLQGLVRLSLGGSADRYPGAAEHRNQAALSVEDWTASVVSHLASAEPSQLVENVQTLVITALLNGNCPPGSSTTDYLQAMFVEPEPLEESNSQYRTKKWRDLATKTAQDREKLQEDTLSSLGETRGTGAVRVIDAGRLVEVIEPFVQDSNLKAETTKSQSLVKKFQDAVADEWKALTNASTSTEHTEPDVLFTKQIERVLDAFTKTHELGMFDDQPVLAAVRELKDQGSEQMHRSVFDVAELNVNELSVLEKAQHVAGPRALDVYKVAEFATQSKRVLDNIEAELDSRSSDSNDSRVDASQIVADVLSAIGGVEDSVKDLLR